MNKQFVWTSMAIMSFVAALSMFSMTSGPKHAVHAFHEYAAWFRAIWYDQETFASCATVTFALFGFVCAINAAEEGAKPASQKSN